jgi:peroxiredoxin
VLVATLCALVAASPTFADVTVGREAPNCSLTLPDGSLLSLQNYRGKIVYLDFWASWCAPCQISFRFMNDLQNASAKDGLQVVAVNMDEVPADEQRFLASHPAGFTVAADSEAHCAKALKVETMPSSFVIDRQGRIRVEHRGFRAGDVSALREQIEHLLSE